MLPLIVDHPPHCAGNNSLRCRRQSTPLVGVHLSALFVHLGDGQRRRREVVGQKLQPFVGFGIGEHLSLPETRPQ